MCASMGYVKLQVMARLLYSLLFYLLMPLILLRLFWMARKEPLYRYRIRERFGWVEPKVRPASDKAPLVWVHAVSAGETNAAAPLIIQLSDKGHCIWMTSTTATGRQRVQALFGDDCLHSFVPYDVPDALTRFMDRVHPDLLILIDTELWPNMIHVAAQRGVPVALVNGRMSQGSHRRYRRIHALVSPMLRSLSLLAVQSDAHRERMVSLGARRDRVRVTGSIKFDVQFPADLDDGIALFRRFSGDRPVLLGASTHDGEESVLLTAFTTARRACPNLLLVLAPRHPARAGDVQEEITRHGFSCVRRTQLVDDAPDLAAIARDVDVLLVDTMGELLFCYGIASVAFVGGSLAEVGGHNPIEALSLNVPVMMGPNLWDIEDIAQQLLSAGAMVKVVDDRECAEFASRMLTDSPSRNEVLVRSGQVLDINRGSLTTTVKLLDDLVGSGI